MVILKNMVTEVRVERSEGGSQEAVAASGSDDPLPLEVRIVDFSSAVSFDARDCSTSQRLRTSRAVLANDGLAVAAFIALLSSTPLLVRVVDQLLGRQP